MNLSVEKKFVFNNHSAPVYALEEFNDSGFFSGGGDRIVSARGLQNDSEARAIVKTNDTIYSLKFLSEKKILLVGVSGGGMHVIDFDLKKEIHFFTAHQKGIFDIKFSLKNDLILTTGGDGRLLIWSASDYSIIKSFALCTEKVRTIALNKEENIVAVGCGDGFIRIFDLKSFQQIHSYQAHESSVNSVCFHPNQDILISGSRDAHLKMWNLENFKVIQSIPAHNYAIYSIVFSKDQKLFATGSRDRTIKIWDSENLNFIYRIDEEKNEGHRHSVNKIIWINNMIVSGSDDRKIIGWNINHD